MAKPIHAIIRKRDGAAWSLLKNLNKNRALHLMILPCLILLFVYYYLPLCGLKIAFEKFIPSRGLFGAQEYVGLKWFHYLFKMEDFKLAIRNTLTIAFWKLVLTMLVSILFAVLINEMRRPAIKRTVQTVVYLPHFISWVILAGVFVDLLSPTEGVVNRLIAAFGGKPIYFIGSNKWFQSTLIVTDIWKEFGFGTIVYLAAITSIDQGLYEASIIDGANKLRQIWHVTLPGLINIITLMALLNIGAILNGNFDQVYNMYSPQVYNSGDILDTLVYRIGLVDFNFSLATAVGVFKSLVSMVLISASYFAAWKFADYRIF